MQQLLAEGTVGSCQKGEQHHHSQVLLAYITNYKLIHYATVDPAH